MVRVRQLFAPGEGSADPFGDTFTSSVSERQINPRGGERFLKELRVGYRGDLAACQTVAIETFLDLVNPLVYKSDQERIRLRGTDIFALNVAWFGNTPHFLEGAAGEDDKVSAMRIPVNDFIGREPSPALAFSVTRSAVTNVSAEDLHVSAKFLTNPPSPMPGRIDAREISVTLGGSTGVVEDLVDALPRIGALQGILFRFENAATATADTPSLSRVFLETEQGRFGDYTYSDVTGAEFEYFGEVPTGPLQDILTNYGWIELRDEPIDLVADRVAVRGTVANASDTVRVIPVIEIAQEAAE